MIVRSLLPTLLFATLALTPLPARAQTAAVINQDPATAAVCVQAPSSVSGGVVTTGTCRALGSNAGSAFKVDAGALGGVAADAMTAGGNLVSSVADAALKSGYHVPTKAALAALAVVPLPAYVHRDGYYAAGDGGAATYARQAGACSLNSGAGDGGSQVPVSGGGGCWTLAAGSNSEINVAVWGAAPAPTTTDNGPMLDAAYAWAATVGGARLYLGKGSFPFGTTFDCHGASGTSLRGVGNATVLYRNANYGNTMTCSNASNIKVADLFAYHDLGIDTGATANNPSYNPDTAFVSANATTGSAHFSFTNINHLTFDRVTAWNMNYQFRMISCIECVWREPFTTGYYSPAHPQSLADFVFDGVDGTGLGHPQLIRIIDIQGQGTTRRGQTVTYTSGSNTRTVTGSSTDPTVGQRVVYGSLDQILLRSVEGFELIGGILNDAYQSNLHLQPTSAAGRPLIKVAAHGTWFDGAGVAGVYIENQGQGTCTTANSFTTDVLLDGNLFVGETYGLFGVYAPPSTCPAVKGLFIKDPDASAFVRTPFYLGSVNGGYIQDGSARSYNWWGVYANDVGQGSCVYLAGATSNFDVNGLACGGGQNFEPIDAANPPGSATLTANQTQFGVSIAAGLTNVTRRGIKNNGYFTDFNGPAPTVTCSGGATCQAQLTSDSARGWIKAATGTAVTTATVTFSGPLASTANPVCQVTDAQTSANAPVAAAITATAPSTNTGFAVKFASDIQGGSFKYRCD